MLRYQVIGDPTGHFIVFPAWIGVVSIGRTYATRAEAQGVADQLNEHA